MTKKIILKAFSLLLLLQAPAFSNDISEYIIEKKVNIDQKTGFIVYSDIKKIKNQDRFSKTINASKTRILEQKKFKYGNYTFKIADDLDSFSSLIQIIDPDGKEIKRISVARKAEKIVFAPETKKLFVLCKGYFGSVWEIDVEKGIVLKKYSTNTNPLDISIDESEKFLYIVSNKVQKFMIGTNVVTEIPLPKEVNTINSIDTYDNEHLKIMGIDQNKAIKYFKLEVKNNSIETINESFSSKKVEAIKLRMEYKNNYNSSDLAIIYNQNNDYLNIFSLKKGEIISLIALDANADQLVISDKLKKAFVLHRSIGQISIIDLLENTNTQFSVIDRVVDNRLKDSTNNLTLEGDKLYIKSDIGQEGYLKTDNILRFTSPVVEIPFNKTQEKFSISNIYEKRYYLKNRQIFLENITDESTFISKKLRVSKFGSSIGGIEISNNGKTLYYSDMSENTVVVVNIENHEILARIVVGSQPSGILLDDKNKFLYVLNNGDNTIGTIDLEKELVTKLSRLKIENNHLKLIKIYDKDFDQIINLNLSPKIDKDIKMVKIKD